jgi:hypothetical protein
MLGNDPQEYATVFKSIKQLSSKLLTIVTNIIIKLVSSLKDYLVRLLPVVYQQYDR